MHFAVLGPLEVIAADGCSVRVPERKVRALLAGLLAHNGRVVPAERLIESLWGPEPPGKPLGALRAKVSQLRRALDEAEPGARELVVTRPTGFSIDGDTDVRRFQEAAGRARSSDDPGERAALLAEALEWWRGPAYADFDDLPGEPLVRGAADLLEEQRLAVLEDYAEVRLALGQDASLVGELAGLAAQHPLRERFHGLLMRALYRSERQAEALKVYQALRERMRDELGLDPGPELAALHQAILEQRPGLRRPPVPPAPAPGRLPEPLTGLVGRDEALAELVTLPGTARLVTLTGTAGVGKSRLALEAARRLAGDFPDGVYWVDLLAVASDVAEAIEAALGPRDNGGAGLPGERIASAFGSRRALLVLDNCEHVVEPVAKLAELLLRAGSGPRVVATSREPLGVAGEVVREVAPLDAAAAALLFSARAADAGRGPAVSAADAAAVEVICRRLDGIPLALELAAARVPALGVKALAERLDDRFPLLSAGRRAGPAHQRTLKAAIDWSWELLTEPERVVLRRLSVQIGGCTLGAAERVCAVPLPVPGGPPGDAAPATRAVLGPDIDPADVAGLLARLVDRSLVVRSEGRYRLLESVAIYALERLREAGEHDLVLRWYATYYTQLAECAESYQAGPARHRWIRRLDAETANLHGALEAAVRLGDTRLATRLTGSLGWYRAQAGRAWAGPSEAGPPHGGRPREAGGSDHPPQGGLHGVDERIAFGTGVAGEA
ncbi:BTAD domain-containing putative transcriptional regulator [Nonomuraea sp. B10E15]|uniref:BTAD domain-containing putative transcriptional regulator n=1 Tax=Nonomuraea sp. B10E15 TaxID=3153560 RepID=UPI00325F2A29